MDETVTDDGVAAWRKTSHQLVLTEIERSRIDSLESSWHSRTSSSIRRFKGNRACITDTGRNAARVQSFKKQHGVDEVDKMDANSVKYATLYLRNNKSRTNDAEKQKIREGMLYKTSRGKITSNLIRGQHEHRQHRRFQLTEHSLEYSQLLQRVKVRKQFPLTSIIEIVYNEKKNPSAFILQFEKSEILLEARDKLDCQIWIKDIREAWKKWPKPVRTSMIATTPMVESSAEDQGGDVKHVKITETTGKEIPQLPLSLPSEAHPHEYLHRGPDSVERSFRSHALPTKIAIREKFGLIPRICSFEEEKLDEGDDLGALHNLDFAMIKYPRNRKHSSLPHERVFTMDYDNQLIMWRQTEHSKFNHLHTLSTEDIVDVREGQNSDGFDHYPYEEVKEQSFSILVEGEMQAGPSSTKYAVLQSFDLVCDSEKEQKLWCQALRKLISQKRHVSMFSSRFELNDPTILWLKSHWTIMSGGKPEIKEDPALLFSHSIMPQMHTNALKSYLNVAHQYDLRESSYHGNSLHWDNYILFYNMLCGVDNYDCLLFQIYQEYVKDFTLGMTMEEFKKFLIEQQHWSPDDTTNERCNQLKDQYDHNHKAFKMYLANKKPKQYRIALDNLSFAGFLSFLRSVDNCVIYRKHEAVYQDMDQPLSHYFINSSHNTYLEGHQLTGRSTTDAYVRALLQGCRCLELDCWNGPNGDPKITHGNTLVSDLWLEEVARTIKEYAFLVSDYPVILSLENHCNEAQQAKMAAIFQEVFGDMLVQKNLVDEQHLSRLPSPNEMKGKIILKGRKRSPEQRVLYERRETWIPSQLQKIGKIFKPSLDNDNKRSESRASQEKLDNIENRDTLESNHSDEQDNITIRSYKTESDEEYKPEYEEEQSNLHKNLSKLVVYCQATHIKPWSWVEQQQTSVCNMFSFNENAALTKCKDTREMLACTERQFVRTYPAGTRIESSNYDPIPLWNHGIQMVALNVQTPEWPMYLNQGKFRQNGGCGYILKPKIMRNSNEKVYTPNMTSPHDAVAPVDLEITLLSGQNFIIPNKKTSTMEILYQTHGIPHDCEQLKHNSSSDDTNPLWPQFSNAVQLKKTILMPELCLVLFAVNISVHRKLKAGTKQVFLGQNVFPLTSLKPGIHFIPLRKPGGDPISHIGIFVEIKLSYGQASEEIHQQSIEASISSPDLFDTQQTNESLEDTTGSVENSEWNDKKLQSNHSGIEVYHKSPKLSRQQALVVADVHCNTITSSDC